MPRDAQILIATPVKNSEHELPAYFSSILRLNYPKHLISVFVLESDSEDSTDQSIRAFMASQTTAPLTQKLKNIQYERMPVGFVMPAESRHLEAVQLRRRQVLAEARNAVLDIVDLNLYDYVLWIDVDATGFPDSLVEDLIAVHKPLVAPHVVWDFGSTTYDRNSWLETYTSVFNKGETAMFEGYGETEGARIYMDDYRVITRGKFAEVPLHGVGTAVLLVDARVHREAELRFPVQPYKRRVESEGFGLLAMDAGYQAVGLPNYEIKHVNQADHPGTSEEVIAEVIADVWDYSYTSLIPMAFFILIALFLYKRRPIKQNKF
jgi:mannan polymerase complexes MNN9 subunit